MLNLNMTQQQTCWQVPVRRPKRLPGTRERYVSPKSCFLHVTCIELSQSFHWWFAGQTASDKSQSKLQASQCKWPVQPAEYISFTFFIIRGLTTHSQTAPGVVICCMHAVSSTCFLLNLWCSVPFLQFCYLAMMPHFHVDVCRHFGMYTEEWRIQAAN